MTPQDTRALSGLLEPLRDLVIGQLLQEVGGALGRGLKVRAEPTIRDSEGRIVRNGGLHLPRRGDLAVTGGGSTQVQRVRSESAIDFAPLTIGAEEGFVAVVAPFRWDAVPIALDRGAEGLDPTPIRRWYLEAFQSRYGELAPDLDGAVHALTGPSRRGDTCCFCCDLGSAPVEAFAEMLGAFARSGATRAEVGHRGVREPAGRA